MRLGRTLPVTVLVLSALATPVCAQSSTQAQSAPAATARPAAVTAAMRARAEAQVSANTGWCAANMREMRSLLDCSCFAQAVLKQQLAHPELWRTDPDHPGPEPPPAHDVVTGITLRVNCAECLTDERIAAYIADMMEASYANSMTMYGTHQEKLDERRACLTETFGRLIRAQPYPDVVLRLFNTASTQCAGARP